MRFLVTGGAGFIGTHLVKSLVDSGNYVVVVDKNHKSESILNSRGVAPNRVYSSDISDFDRIDFLFKKEKFDGVFHLAAEARIQPSFKYPLAYFQSNVIGTINILKLAAEYGVRRVVYAASSSAYGNRDHLPFKESDFIPSLPEHPYGSTKREGEMWTRILGKMTGGPETVILRLFNVYGPWQAMTSSGPYATVIGIFLDLAKQGKPLTIVPPGTQRRDFTYVADVVRAFINAMHNSNIGNAEIINVGCGRNYSIFDVAKMVLKLPPETPDEELFKSGKCVWAPERKGEVLATLADNKRAADLLGWKPEISLPEGIKLCRQNDPRLA